MSINLYFCNPVRLKEPVIVKVMTTKTQQIRIEDFDYPLPDERIAKFPLPKRDESKLLLYKEGKVKSIGVSNFYPDRLVDICLFSEIKPMVNQIEINVFNQQNEAKKWADKYGVVLEAWAPFAEGRNNMLKNETLTQIANKHNKTVAQVILRWLLQREIVSLAKSVHENRIKENYDIFSFSLDEEDMNLIATLDKQTSSFFSHQDPKMIEWFGDLIIQRRGK